MKLTQKVVVFGGRTFSNREIMDLQIKTLVKAGVIDPEATLICGMARGADMTAHYLWKHVYHNPIEEFHADWSTRSGGILRNIDMGNIADAGVGFWDGQSRGTKHMIDYLNKLKKPCFVCLY